MQFWYAQLVGWFIYIQIIIFNLVNEYYADLGKMVLELLCAETC